MRNERHMTRLLAAHARAWDASGRPEHPAEIDRAKAAFFIGLAIMAALMIAGTFAQEAQNDKIAALYEQAAIEELAR